VFVSKAAHGVAEIVDARRARSQAALAWDHWHCTTAAALTSQAQPRLLSLSNHTET
jgi:hypothetical protein